MRPFAILGDSHVEAFLNGVRQASHDEILIGGGWASGRRFQEPFFETRFEQIVVAPDLYYTRWQEACRGRLEDFPGRLIVSLGLAPTFFAESRMWWRVDPSSRPYSSGLIATMIDDLQEHILQFYEVLIARGLIAAAYMGPPPQRRDRCFQFMTLRKVEELSAAYRAPVLALLVSHNIPVIDLPLKDEDGFLRNEFCGPNSKHASEAIGGLALSALQSLQAD